MKNSRSKMNRIVLINILSTILLSGMSMLTAPIFSRMLGAANYGVASVFLTWVSAFSIILSLQTGSTLNVAKTKFPGEESRYQSSIMALSMCSFFIGTLLLMVFRESVSSIMQLSVRMIPLILIQAYGTSCVGLLNGKNTIDFQAGRNLLLSLSVSLANVIVSILFITWIPKEHNYWGRILATALVYGVFGIAITCFFFRRGKNFYSKKYWAFCIPLAIPIIFHALANLVLGQCDRLMLQRMLSAESVGIYSLAASFSGIMSSIWNALNNSWSPFFHEYGRNGQIREIREHGRNYLELYSVLTIGFMLLTPEVFHLFADETFWSGTQLIPVLALGHYFVFLYSFAVNYEFFNCQTKSTAMGTLLAAVCNIVLNVLLITRMGALGAALATMLAHGLQYAFHHVIATRIKGSYTYPFNLKMILPYATATVLVGLCLTLVPGSWFLRWGLGAVLGLFELRKIMKRKAIF